MVFENILTVTIIKNPLYGFGIAISEKEKVNTCDLYRIFISDVVREGPSWNKLKLNDFIIAVNNVSLEHFSYEEALNLLQLSGNIVTLIVNRKEVIPDTRSVVLNKHLIKSLNISFKQCWIIDSIDDAIDSDIQLRKGDCIYKINNSPTENLTLSEFTNIINSNDPITLYINNPFAKEQFFPSNNFSPSISNYNNNNLSNISFPFTVSLPLMPLIMHSNTCSLGLHLKGGNKSGLFIANIEPQSLSQNFTALKVGLKIVALNQESMIGVTKEYILYRMIDYIGQCFQSKCYNTSGVEYNNKPYSIHVPYNSVNNTNTVSNICNAYNLQNSNATLNKDYINLTLIECPQEFAYALQTEQGDEFYVRCNYDFEAFEHCLLMDNNSNNFNHCDILPSPYCLFPYTNSLTSPSHMRHFIHKNSSFNKNEKLSKCNNNWSQNFSLPFSLLRVKTGDILCISDTVYAGQIGLWYATKVWPPVLNNVPIVMNYRCLSSQKPHVANGINQENKNLSVTEKDHNKCGCDIKFNDNSQNGPKLTSGILLNSHMLCNATSQLTVKDLNPEKCNLNGMKKESFYNSLSRKTSTPSNNKKPTSLYTLKEYEKDNGDMYLDNNRTSIQNTGSSNKSRNSKQKVNNMVKRSQSLGRFKDKPTFDLLKRDSDHDIQQLSMIRSPNGPGFYTPVVYEQSPILRPIIFLGNDNIIQNVPKILVERLPQKYVLSSFNSNPHHNLDSDHYYYQTKQHRIMSIPTNNYKSTQQSFANIDQPNSSECLKCVEKWKNEYDFHPIVIECITTKTNPSLNSVTNADLENDNTSHISQSSSQSITLDRHSTLKNNNNVSDPDCKSKTNSGSMSTSSLFTQNLDKINATLKNTLNIGTMYRRKNTNFASKKVSDSTITKRPSLRNVFFSNETPTLTSNNTSKSNYKNNQFSKSFDWLQLLTGIFHIRNECDWVHQLDMFVDHLQSRPIWMSAQNKNRVQLGNQTPITFSPNINAKNQIDLNVSKEIKDIGSLKTLNQSSPDNIIKISINEKKNLDMPDKLMEKQTLKKVNKMYSNNSSLTNSTIICDSNLLSKTFNQKESPLHSEIRSSIASYKFDSSLVSQPISNCYALENDLINHTIETTESVMKNRIISDEKENHPNLVDNTVGVAITKSKHRRVPPPLPPKPKRISSLLSTNLYANSPLTASSSVIIAENLKSPRNISKYTTTSLPNIPMKSCITQSPLKVKSEKNCNGLLTNGLVEKCNGIENHFAETISKNIESKSLSGSIRQPKLGISALHCDSIFTNTNNGNKCLEKNVGITNKQKIISNGHIGYNNEDNLAFPVFHDEKCFGPKLHKTNIKTSPLKNVCQ